MIRLRLRSRATARPGDRVRQATLAVQSELCTDDGIKYPVDKRAPRGLQAYYRSDRRGCHYQTGNMAGASLIPPHIRPYLIDSVLGGPASGSISRLHYRTHAGALIAHSFILPAGEEAESAENSKNRSGRPFPAFPFFMQTTLVLLLRLHVL